MLTNGRGDHGTVTVLQEKQSSLREAHSRLFWNTLGKKVSLHKSFGVR